MSVLHIPYKVYIRDEMSVILLCSLERSELNCEVNNLYHKQRTCMEYTLSLNYVKL